MFKEAPVRASFFSELQRRAPDPLLSIIGQCRADKRAHKIDVGVGVFRNDAGETPVLQAIKAAECELLETQHTKAYLGPEGDLEFIGHMADLAMGQAAERRRLVGVQTPGGTGALRQAAALVRVSKPDARVFVGTPSWPIHEPIFHHAGLAVQKYRYFNRSTQTVAFDEMMDALGGARRGDLVLLHGACHNPTGADLTLAQWCEVAKLLDRTGAVPLVDLAYQGLGDGLEQDAAGLRLILDACETTLVAYSCDKNFGLYRERTGAFFAHTQADPDIVRSNALEISRTAWSMPPDHGAAAVNIILRSPALTKLWKSELAAMQARLSGLRALLADQHPCLASLRNHRGMFALLDLTAEDARALARDHAIYLAESGRINIAGLREDTVGRFARAIATLRESDPS